MANRESGGTGGAGLIPPGSPAGARTMDLGEFSQLTRRLIEGLQVSAQGSSQSHLSSEQQSLLLSEVNQKELFDSLARRETHKRAYLSEMTSQREALIPRFTDLETRIVRKQQLLKRRERVLSAQCGQLLKAFKTEEARVNKLSKAVHRIGKTKKELLARITEPAWAVPHHYHMTAIEHTTGHTQPHVMEVGTMIRGHLKIYAIANSSTRFQKHANHVSEKAKAVRSKISEQIKKVYSELRLTRGHIRETESLLAVLRDRTKGKKRAAAGVVGSAATAAMAASAAAAAAAAAATAGGAAAAAAAGMNGSGHADGAASMLHSGAGGASGVVSSLALSSSSSSAAASSASLLSVAPSLVVDTPEDREMEREIQRIETEEAREAAEAAAAAAEQREQDRLDDRGNGGADDASSVSSVGGGGSVSSHGGSPPGSPRSISPPPFDIDVNERAPFAPALTPPVLSPKTASRRSSRADSISSNGSSSSNDEVKAPEQAQPPVKPPPVAEYRVIKMRFFQALNLAPPSVVDQDASSNGSGARAGGVAARAGGGSRPASAIGGGVRTGAGMGGSAAGAGGLGSGHSDAAAAEDLSCTVEREELQALLNELDAVDKLRQSAWEELEWVLDIREKLRHEVKQLNHSHQTAAAAAAAAASSNAGAVGMAGGSSGSGGSAGAPGGP